jgi:hypothetical protein
VLNVLAVLQFAYTVSTEDHQQIIAGSLIGLGILGASSLVLPRWWNVAITLAVAAILLGSGALIYVNPSFIQPPQTAPSTSTVYVTSPPPAATHLTINQPTGQVPRCNTITGTGTIPAGMTLLLFDRGSMESTEPYWFDGVAQPTATGWSVSGVEIGDGNDPGAQSQLLIVLVNQNLGNYIASITTDSSAGWSATVPPAPPLETITVVHSGVGPPCS